MKKNLSFLKIGLGLCLLGTVAACTSKVPATFQENGETPLLTPDYTNLTLPYNIAPLNFTFNEEGEQFLTVLSMGDQKWLQKGKEVHWNIKKWQHFLESAKGKPIEVTTYIRRKGNWEKKAAFYWNIAEEPIDPYISYRLIAPSYVTYEELTINQRNLATFDEKVIYNNMLLSTEQQGQCINCHSYKNYKTDNMQFHARQHKGGTLLVTNGEVRKINLKTDSTLSAGVYPSWHPTHNFIAYSVNNTGQSFHTRDSEKIEVQDMASDLILYDIDANEVSIVENDSTEWEVFPWWAPDGKTLYYSSAHFVRQDTAQNDREIIDSYQLFKYDLYKKSFDPETKQFGPKEKLFDASALQKSATLARVSPDGNYLLFALGDYGCFHIWHKSADLYLMDLRNGSVRNMKEINSPDVESYHSWSSNGRWILFSSRRDDGGFTRLYIAYFDKNGKGHKPFVLPQKSAHFYADFYKSYNIPEYMLEPVKISPQEFADCLDQEAQKVKFKSHY